MSSNWILGHVDTFFDLKENIWKNSKYTSDSAFLYKIHHISGPKVESLTKQNIFGHFVNYISELCRNWSRMQGFLRIFQNYPVNLTYSSIFISYSLIFWRLGRFQAKSRTCYAKLLQITHEHCEPESDRYAQRERNGNCNNYAR